LLAIAGCVGIAKAIGDWAFERWGESASGPLAALTGSVVWFFGALVPIVGWLAGLLSLFAGLGAAVLVILHPRAYDEGGEETVRGEQMPAPARRPLRKLSVIIPAYNEQTTVREVIKRVTSLQMPLEVIVVDDGSTDGTPEILREEGEDEIVRVYTSPVNFGKGAAIRAGLSFVTGDVVIIQDADLELDPEEYPRLLRPIVAGRTNVVYGSRFLHKSPGVPWRTRVANRLLARWCNFLYGSKLTDVSTAYKIFRAELIDSVALVSIGFEFCVEITAKLLRLGAKIEEVPVGFHPRGEAEGKKLNYLTDGLRAAWWLLWLRFARIPQREQSDS
jgi:dolichol-phosphate mannosyltransferase